jgi:hypothetical protein
MADVRDDLDRVVVSELPDLTGCPLGQLPDARVPLALVVLDRALADPAQDQQEQVN